MNKERNLEIRKYFKNDDAILKAHGVLGNAPIYLGALVKVIIRERIIVMLDNGMSDMEIHKATGKSQRTVYRIRSEWVKDIAQ